MAGEDDKIGLKAEIDVAMVEAAAAAYAKAVAKMEDQTDSSGDVMSSAFDGVERAWNSLTGGIDVGKEIITGALRKVGEVALGALGDAANAIKDFAVDSFNGAIEAQKGLDELNATIEHLGDAAPISSERALELADQFKNLAGGSDDAVLAAEKVLLRFDKIGGDAFPRVLEQSADLATLFGGDMSKGAEILGKVLQDISTDGVGSIGRLKAAGVQLTDAQEAQILAMVKAGDVAGAQNAVLDALAETTGGAAAAASETLAGKWAIFTESIADAGEGVALQFMPYLEKLADIVLPAITGAVSAVTPALGDLASFLGGFFASLANGDVESAFEYFGESSVLQGFFKTFGVDVLDASAAIKPFFTGIQDIVGALTGFVELVMAGDFGGAIDNLGEWDTVRAIFQGLGIDIYSLEAPFESFMTALSGIGDAVGWAVANLAGGGGLVETLQGLADFSWEDILGADAGAVVTQVIGAVAQFAADVQTNLPIVQQAFTDTWNTIKPALDQLWSVITTEVMPAIGSLKSDVDVQLPTVKQIFEVVSAAIVTAAKLFSDFLINVVIPVIRTVTDFVVANWPTIQATIESVMAAVGDVIDTVLKGAQDFWHEWGDDIQSFTDSMFAAVKDIFSAFSKAFSGDWRGFGEDLRKAWDEIWKAIQEAAQTAIDAILEIDWGAVGDGIAKGIAAGLDAALQWVVEAAVNIAQAALDAAKGALGIKSPSTVFKAEVGLMAGEGLADGMWDSIDAVTAAGKDMASAAVTSASGAIGDLMRSANNWMATIPLNTGIAPSMAGTTYNITNQYFYSPSYGSAPVAPAQDFALMRVFDGA